MRTSKCQKDIVISLATHIQFHSPVHFFESTSASSALLLAQTGRTVRPKDSKRKLQVNDSITKVFMQETL